MALRSKLDLIAVGNLNIDLIGRIKGLPARDEKLLLEEFARCPGGGAANFAVACSRLGLKSGFIGCVGSDEFGKEILADLERENVDKTHVKIVDAPTGLVFALSTPGGDHFSVAYRGANLFLKPEDIDDDYIKKTKLLHASSVTPEVALAVGSKAEKYGLLASLDLGAELAELKIGKLLEIIELFDICFMNRRTYKKVFRGRPSKRGILKNFPEGLEVLVVTMGARGAMATDGKSVASGPPYKVEVRDSTGAGDAFAAAFDVVWLRGGDLEKAIRYALAGAAIKIQRLGAREGLPTMEELEEFVRTHV
ncbi:MAG: carbohydrate kinase family protein [Candidatus Hodarchaeaceae archaeon]|nr:carbohydrate kinase family protein [Candidatus Hodarchaeaceae archaeon]